ncbi:MAG TPA: tRNA (adenosine(37)-N6)-threonylcarbamoyltransferase complex dimerization subunit type 1 TsaB, partial [bacterium]
MILALDTSGSRCGVALWSSDLIGHRESDSALRHNELLLHQIQALLAVYEVGRADLRAVAVSSGPGSFTGLRVGLAVAKGLCWSLRLPLICV